MQRISCVLSSKDDNMQPQMDYSITDEQKEAIERHLEVNNALIDELTDDFRKIKESCAKMNRQSKALLKEANKMILLGRGIAYARSSSSDEEEDIPTVFIDESLLTFS